MMDEQIKQLIRMMEEKYIELPEECPNTEMNLRQDLFILIGVIYGLSAK